MLTFLYKYSLLLIIIAGLVIRLILSLLPGFKIDIDAWASWAIRLNEVGFSKFYSNEVWTNYTPGYFYILYPLGFLQKIFNLETIQFHYLLKLPSIISEVLLVIFSYKILSRLSGKKWAILTSCAIAFNPALIFNSAVWGQVDGLLSFFLLLSVYLLSQNQSIFSALFWSISFLIKPQSIALAPLFTLDILQQKLKNIIFFIFTFIVVTFLFSLPFFTSNLFGVINLLFQMVSDYKYTSLFAYNFWGVIGFWINDSELFFILTYQQFGFLFLSIYLIFIIYLYFKKRISLYTIAALLFLVFFFLPTRVHERYLYPGLIFLFLIAGIYKSYFLYLAAFILSIIHLFNLYFVYVYYNEIHLNLPKVLFNLYIYNFLNHNSKLLSTISVTIFIVISYLVFKLSYAKQINK